MPTLGRRRALGQHFLKDARIARLIADTALSEAHSRKCHALLEIGPGRGAITDPLLDGFLRERLLKDAALEEMILAERDTKLASVWQVRSKMQECAGRVRVEEGDFLELPEERWLARTPLAVASNLPYSAGTAILTRLAARVEQIPVMVLMFQAEVAQRLRAQASTKAWGSLSVWVQNRWDVRLLCPVPPSAFMPPPQVQSEVVVLTARAEPRVPIGHKGARDAGSEARWEGLLKLCFAHRRKMLRSGLPGGSPARKALDIAGIDGQKRAEALTWEEWRRLYEALPVRS